MTGATIRYRFRARGVSRRNPAVKQARGKKKAEDPGGEGASRGPGLAHTGHGTRTAGGPSERAPEGGSQEEQEVAPDAYVVSLPVFEGPLDLLLEIIQKHELDILDIPVGFVTEKYLEYLKVMQSMAIDVASEYLVMAATLTLIKSRMLLPDDPTAAAADGEEEEELDPRAELVRRLLEYQRYKAAGEVLTSRDTLGSSVFPRGPVEEIRDESPAPFASFGVLDLLGAFKKILEKTKVKIDHEVVFDRIGITERIVELTELLGGGARRRTVAFEDIFASEGRAPTRFDLIITFLAVLEMCRMKMMRVFQADTLGSIHLELLVVSEDGEDLDAEPEGDRTEGDPEGEPGATPAAEASVETPPEPADPDSPAERSSAAETEEAEGALEAALASATEESPLEGEAAEEAAGLEDTPAAAPPAESPLERAGLEEAPAAAPSAESPLEGAAAESPPESEAAEEVAAPEDARAAGLEEAPATAPSAERPLEAAESPPESEAAEEAAAPETPTSAEAASAESAANADSEAGGAALLEDELPRSTAPPPEGEAPTESPALGNDTQPLEEIVG
jgi:segregation and condensation protein A